MVPYNELDQTAAVTMAFYQRDLKFMGTIIGIGACLGLIGLFPCPLLYFIYFCYLGISHFQVHFQCSNRANLKSST